MRYIFQLDTLIVTALHFLGFDWIWIHLRILNIFPK